MPSRHFLKKCSQPWGPHLMLIGAFAKCRLTFVMTVLQFTETSDPIQLLVLLSRVWLCNLMHARLPCLSLSPRVCSNSYPLSRWYHPNISSSIVPFSSRLQSFPASSSFLMSHLFASGGQSIGVSALGSVLPMNIQSSFLLGLTVWISLPSKGLSRVFLSTTFWKHQFFSAQPSLWSLTSIHDYWKNHSFSYRDLCR